MATAALGRVPSALLTLLGGLSACILLAACFRGAPPHPAHSSASYPAHPSAAPPARPEATLGPLGYSPSSVAFSPDGKTLAIGDQYGSTYLWDVATGKLTATLSDADGEDIPFGSVGSVAFSPDGETLAAADGSGSTYLWDVATGKLTATLSDPDLASTVDSVAFSPDGRTLATGDNDGSTYLWDVATGKLTGTLSDPDGASTIVSSVAFSPDGRTLATGEVDGSTYLWNLAAGRLGHRRPRRLRRRRHLAIVPSPINRPLSHSWVPQIADDRVLQKGW